MFKRFTNKQLLITLAGLAGVYLLLVAFGGRKARTFEKTLAAVDTASVTKILISPPAKAQVELNKVSGVWRLKLPNGSDAPVQSSSLKSSLGNLSLLEATQLVSRDEEDWGEYQVDSSGTQVQLFAGENQVMDVVLGNFTYRATGMNYVRLSDDEDTYLVEGYLEGSFNKAANDWREKKLASFVSSNVIGIGRSDLDNAFQLVKDSTQAWVMSGEEVGLDNTEITSYLTSLSNLNGTEFVDRKPASMTPASQVSIQTSTSGIIELKAFVDAEHGHLIQSSVNPESYFSGNAGGLYDKIFVTKDKFYEKESEE